MKTHQFFLFLFLFTLIGSIFTSCTVWLHRDNGMHRGWYKNNNHRDHKVYIITPEKNKHPKKIKQQKPKTDKDKKNRWDAQK